MHLYRENVLIFEHLGAPQKALVSFIGRDHMMVMDPPMARRMADFAVAFFGYHLQRKEDMKQYFSQELVS